LHLINHLNILKIKKGRNKKRMNKTIIFSDIDGTFLNEKYQITFDRYFLKKVSEQFKIVFVSSRTADEIIFLLDQIGWQFDFIAENGGIIGLHKNVELLDSNIKTEEIKSYKLIHTGKPLESIKIIVKDFLNYNSEEATILNDMPASDVALLSGYDEESASRALQRRAAVLINVDKGNVKFINTLKKEMEIKGLTVQYGGRWFSVSSGFDKGQAIQYYLKIIGYQDKTVGIGNSDNDYSLLKSVQQKFIINENGYNKQLSLIPDAQKLLAKGVNGWEEMINKLQTK